MLTVARPSSRTSLPLSSFRIATMMGHDWGQKAQFGTGTIFCLSGFVNCVMYATTRKLVCSPPPPPKLVRDSR